MNETLMKIKRTASRTGLKVQKYSPEILLGLGIVSFVGTVALACRQTLKAEEILKDHQEQMKDIEEAVKVAEERPEKYTYDEELIVSDRKVRVIKTTVALTKTYAPVAALSALSLTCILVSRNILNKRYLGAVAAYNGVSAVFQEYRNRVIAEQGEIMDRHFRYGTELEEIEKVEVDENGKKHKTKELVEKKDGNLVVLPEDTARFFDDRNPNYDRNPEFTMAFLRGQQSYFNDLLVSRGHVFLNEVYNQLGFPPSQEGCVMGWLDDNGRPGQIDFGLYKYDNTRDFVNGEVPYVLLEFNLPKGDAGIIWDKI